MKHRGGGEDDQAVEERRNVHGRARERVQAQLRAAGAVRHRGATSACGRHVHSAAATTAAPALGSPCNNLCELSRPAAWLDMSPLACRRGLLSIIEQIMSDEKQILTMLTTDCFPCLCLDVMEENC